MTKESESGDASPESGLQLSYSSVSMQGWRRTQEDAHLVNMNLTNGESIFGVFDGHGGREIALFCKREYVNTLESLESFKKGDYELALQECSIKLDE